VSNVIIGIIGVILFIGLAVAGTVILGSDFMTAASTSKAAVVTSHLQQIAQASQGLKARRGATVPSNAASFGAGLVAQNALKSIPVNPMVPGNAYLAANASFGQDSRDASYVYTSLGNNGDKRTRDVCFAIEETAGNANPAAVVDVPVDIVARVVSIGRLGCANAQQSGQYMAFAPA
jgi:hypothetical protein